MKEKPEFQAGCTSDRYIDKHGRRIAYRLCRWSDGRYSIAFGLATKAEGSKELSKFGRYINLPVEFLDDIGHYAPHFVSLAKKKMAANAAVEADESQEGEPDG